MENNVVNLTPFNKEGEDIIEKNRNLTIKEIYKIFGSLMIKFEILDLDQGFNKFLNLDGINLDIETKKIIGRELSDKIANILKSYEYVFIKLNSKSAIDCDFLCCQLKCFTLDDILTLLKGSSRINEVFNPYYKNYLILKPWYKIDHKFEFRLYYINKKLKGISQRYIDLYEEYEDIDKIRECIINFNNSEAFKNCLNNVEIDNEGLHYMIIDIIYLESKNKVKIIDVETLNPNENNIPLEDALPTVYTVQHTEEQKKIEETKALNKKQNKGNSKKSQFELLQEEEEKKHLEMEEKIKNEFLEEWSKKKINKDDYINLFTWDELLIVDDEDDSEIELRIIESDDDSRIVENQENTNKYPLELLENENDLEGLIRKLNIK